MGGGWSRREKERVVEAKEERAEVISDSGDLGQRYAESPCRCTLFHYLPEEVKMDLSSITRQVANEYSYNGYPSMTLYVDNCCEKAHSTCMVRVKQVDKCSSLLPPVGWCLC